MDSESKRRLPQSDVSEHWLWELVLPGVFSLVLIGCLFQLACYAWQARSQPVNNFQYAISAFAL
jgi:hypothetical protein